MKWDKVLGLWTLIRTEKFAVYGSTFRNADYLTLTVDVGDYTVDLFFGRHIGMHFWRGEEIKQYEWKPKNCKCFGCAMHQPLSPENAEAIRKVLRKIRKPE